MTTAVLHAMCGKMAAGKSTLAARIARDEDAVLLAEDTLLETLYPGEIREIADYVRCSGRLKAAIADLVVQVLAGGRSVVLDFPGNTVNQRRVLRAIAQRAGVPLRLHWVDVPDAVCRRQLARRSAGLPDGAPFTTDAEFDAVTRYFQPPDAQEGIEVVAYRDGDR